MVRDVIAHFPPVQVGVDCGAKIEIIADVSLGDHLVKSLNDDIWKEAKVKAIQAPPGQPERVLASLPASP